MVGWFAHPMDSGVKYAIDFTSVYRKWSDHLISIY